MAEKDAKAAQPKRGDPKGEPPNNNLLIAGLALIVLGSVYTVWDVWIRDLTPEEKKEREAEIDRQKSEARREAAEKAMNAGKK